MATIDFVYFDAGGGHRSAAYALIHAIQEQQRPWDCRLVNLQEVLDPVDKFRKLTGVRLQDFYNLILRKGWTAGSAQMLRVLHLAVRAYHPEQVKLLREHWAGSRPDLVVSLIPHFNRALQESLDEVLPSTPLATVLTDLADYPPEFWIQTPRQNVISGTPRAAEQARAAGCPEDHIWQTSGMIVHPKFYETAPLDRADERVRLGLDPETPTAVVLFGGHGSSVMVEIARRLAKAGVNVQLIVLCGRNEKLAARLRSLRLRLRMLVVSYTTEVPFYMRLGDFFIGKPGPGSVSEALAMGLPVIVERSARTLVQERYNTEWILEQGVGMVASSFSEIARPVEHMLRPENYRRFRAAITRVDNRAVFEIPAILQSILARAAANSRPPRARAHLPGGLFSDRHDHRIGL